MENLSKFCTCDDHDCPLHPTNHGRGCAPCIADNLKDNEIPSCFFNKVDANYDKGAYSFEDFARLVIEKQNR